MTDNDDLTPHQRKRPSSIDAIAAAAKKRAVDVIDVRQPPPAPPVSPTPEQSRHAIYVKQEVHEKTPGGGMDLRGNTHRRQARFETIEGLTPLDLRALRLYRQAFDESEISEVKSQLDVGPGGGAGGSDAAIARVQRIAFGGVTLDRIEERIAAHLRPTMRAVALHDRDFKDVAIERFGSRTVQRIDAKAKKPRVTSSIEPRSGKHRQRIRDEFMEGVSQLVGGMPRPTPSSSRALADTAPLPAIDPAFLGGDGRMKSDADIREVILARFAAKIASDEAA